MTDYLDLYLLRISFNLIKGKYFNSFKKFYLKMLLLKNGKFTQKRKLLKNYICVFFINYSQYLMYIIRFKFKKVFIDKKQKYL